MSACDYFTKTKDIEGIINFEHPQNFLADESLELEVKINQKLTQDVLTFIASNGLSPSGNSYILNPKSTNDRVNILITNIKTKDIMGFVLSIPNTLKLNGEYIKSGLTTNRCVSLKNRNKKIGLMLISSVIQYGYENKIFTGYHFIPKPKTDCSIEVLNFFRPLNEKLSIECGYQLLDTDYELNKSSDYTIRMSKYEDYTILFNKNKIDRHLTISPIESEYINFKVDSECLTILYKGKVIGVCIYKSTLLKISKTGKICPVARLVFMECVPNHTHHVMSCIINYLKENTKLIVLSGVCLGNLSDDKLHNRLGMSISGKSYLDFYNLHIDKKYCKSVDVNVLYV